MKKEMHIALLEASILLENAALPTATMCDAMIATHKDPEVIALFEDLKKDWYSEDPNPEFPFKFVKPFADRSTLDEDFAYASKLMEIGSMSTMINVELKNLSYIFLIKLRAKRGEVHELDVAAMQYMLEILSAEERKNLLPVFLSWSSDPLWKRLEEHTEVKAFPEGWRETFEQSSSLTPLFPTMAYVVKSCFESGTFDHLPEIMGTWYWYNAAYETLESKSV